MKSLLMTFKQIKSVENVIIRLAHQLSHAGSDGTVRFPFIIRVLQSNKVDRILECEMIQKYLVEDHWGRSWSRFGGRAAKNVIKRGSGPAMSPLTSAKNLEKKLLACCNVTTRHANKFHLINELWGSCSSSESERFTT